MTWSRAIASGDLYEGEMIGLDVSGERVVVLRLEDGVRAYVDRCAHQGHRVSLGAFGDCKLTCPVHGWRYDARSGEGENPRGVRLRRLEVHEEAGCVFVALTREKESR